MTENEEKEQKLLKFMADLETLLNLQTADVEQRAKTQARKNIIDVLTIDHKLNWQCVATPYDIVNEMLDLIPSDAKKFIVFFSLEFLEEMVKTRGIAPESILFIGDNDMESAVAGNKDMYGVHTAIMSKDTGYQDGKLIFPEIIFNFLNNEDNMKFEKLAIVMNPPYQMNDGGGTGSSAKPIYNLFIESVIDNLNPDHLVSINPSNWMLGGKGLDTFRERMMNDIRVKKIVHFSGESDIFKTVRISGGVNYFHWDKSHNSECQFSHDNSTSHRYLNKYDIIIQDNNAISIVENVLNNSSKWVSETCLSHKPFGLRSNFNESLNTGVKYYYKSGKEIKNNFCSATSFTDKFNILNKYKVCISKTNDDSTPNVAHRITTPPSVFEPDTASTETFLVLHTFTNITEANNFASYVKTKFFRFMVGIRKTSHNLSKNVFSFVPDLEDYSAPWTDKELYKKFNLTRQQVAYIESKIKAI